MAIKYNQVRQIMHNQLDKDKISLFHSPKGYKAHEETFIALHKWHVGQVLYALGLLLIKKLFFFFDSTVIFFSTKAYFMN